MRNQHTIDLVFSVLQRLVGAVRFGGTAFLPVTALALGIVVAGSGPAGITAAVVGASSTSGGSAFSLQRFDHSSGQPSNASIMEFDYYGREHLRSLYWPSIPLTFVLGPVPQLNGDLARVAAYVSQRYRVDGDRARAYVDIAFQVAKEARVDALLLLAIMAVESGFDALAQSNKGAQGLMQILTRVHGDKFAPYGGVHAAFHPIVNVRVGAAILRDYLGRDGSVETALRHYVGAALLPHDGGYAAKVLTERERLLAAISGKTVVPELMLKASLNSSTESMPTDPIAGLIREAQRTPKTFTQDEAKPIEAPGATEPAVDSPAIEARNSSAL
jgi:hypothetical protein